MHASIEELLEAIAGEYPRAGSDCDGLAVGDTISNLASISSSFNDWEELGVRILPFSDFGGIDSVICRGDRQDREHAQRVGLAIEQNGRIDPLIIVVDDEGPYILEGAHRFAGMLMNGRQHFPALLVVDTESLAHRIVPPGRARTA